MYLVRTYPYTHIDTSGRVPRRRAAPRSSIGTSARQTTDLARPSAPYDRDDHEGALVGDTHLVAVGAIATALPLSDCAPSFRC